MIALGAQVRSPSAIWVQATSSGSITGICPSSNAPITITGRNIPLTAEVKTDLSAATSSVWSARQPFKLLWRWNTCPCPKDDTKKGMGNKNIWMWTQKYDMARPCRNVPHVASSSRMGRDERRRVQIKNKGDSGVFDCILNYALPAHPLRKEEALVLKPSMFACFWSPFDLG